MSAARIEQAADLILNARLTHAPVLLPDDYRPQTTDQAYAIQHRVTERLNLPSAGWKIGAASKAVAAAEGASSAVSGRLFQPNVHRSPATLGTDHFTSFRNCEVEFVLRVGRDLPSRTELYTHKDIADAVDRLYPAIEIGDSRLADRATAGFLTVCADNAGGTQLVLGDEIQDWQRLDLPNHSVRMLINDKPVARGMGRDVMGHPINALLWLVNQQNGWNNSVPAGSLIATGTCTGINIAQPGDHALADFGEIGQVEIRF